MQTTSHAISEFPVGGPSAKPSYRQRVARRAPDFPVELNLGTNFVKRRAGFAAS